MKLDSVQTAAMGNWQIFGFFIAMIVNILLIKQNVHHRWIIVSGFSLITISAIYMYFLYQTMATYEMLIFPTICRGAGMWMIYAYCGCMGMNDLNAGKQLGSWVFIMLTFRAVLGPVSGSTLYSNGVYHRSQDYIERFAQEVDSSNSIAETSFKRTQMGMMIQGKSYGEATQMASLSTKGSVQMQATLVALKKITGWTIWGGVAIIILALIFPYGYRWRLLGKETSAP